MTMDTRTRNRRITYATASLWQIPASTMIKPAAGSIWQWGPAFGAEGDYQQVVSERSGFFNPGKFRANPCILRKSTAVRQGGRARTREMSGWVYEVGGDFWNPLAWNDSYAKQRMTEGFGAWDQNMADLARAKALAKIKQADFDAGVALGELKETLELLIHPFRALSEQFMLMRKEGLSRVRKGIAFVDAMSGAWLQYRYGIIPLMCDVQSVIAYHDRRLEQVTVMQRKSGGQTIDQKKTVNLQWSWYVTDWLSVFDFTGVFHDFQSYKTIHHVYYKRLVENENLYVMRTLGLHPDQLVSVLWELTRLSFVVDWVVAVGDWLSAVSPTLSIEYLGACTSQKILKEMSCEVTGVRSVLGLDPAIKVVKPYWRAWSECLERRVITTPLALPAVNPNYAKIARLVDALSLLWQPLSTKLRKR